MEAQLLLLRGLALIGRGGAAAARAPSYHAMQAAAHGKSLQPGFWNNCVQ
jgi:hypothetical protein